MKTKKSILSLILLLSATFPIAAQSLGDKVYKEVTVDGKRVNKWVIFDSITDYDEKGNVIHAKSSSNWGLEYWLEYTFHPNGKLKSQKRYMPF